MVASGPWGNRTRASHDGYVRNNGFSWCPGLVEASWPVARVAERRFTLVQWTTTDASPSLAAVGCELLPDRTRPGTRSPGHLHRAFDARQRPGVFARRENARFRKWRHLWPGARRSLTLGRRDQEAET